MRPRRRVAGPSPVALPAEGTTVELAGRLARVRGRDDEEALAAGWRYSGETVSREGFGWGGLARLLYDAEHPTESA